jgi:hypothetical protein
MRRNYDKPHRCPGWSGPAFKWKHIRGVNGNECGYLAPRRIVGATLEEYRSVDGPDPWNSYGLVRCPGCKTWVLPYWARWLDATYLWWRAKQRVRYWYRERKYR